MAKQFKPLSIDDDLVVNPFRSVSEMCEQLGLPESKFALGWRLTDYDLGAIHGLPLSRGRLAATDGIMCIIIRERLHPYVGHVGWFEIERFAVEDLDVDDSRLVRRQADSTKTKAKFKASNAKSKVSDDIQSLLASL